jgi:hypothetical protein
MTNAEISEALLKLCPGKEWVLSGDDYNDLQWHSEGSAPTLKEIETMILQLPTIKADEQALKATKKAALLERLGITADEAALLLA